MIEHVLGFAARLLVRALSGSETPLRPPQPRPDPLQVEATEAAYRAWAERHELERDAAAGTFRGRLAGREVIVRTGLAESTPGAVELEMRIDHRESALTLLLPETVPTTALEIALSGLFDEASLMTDLRSVAVTRGGLRLRLRALTRPPTIELALRAAAEAVHHASAEVGLSPYR